MLKGWRTILLATLIVAVTASLKYLAGLDWTTLIGAQGAVIIMAVLQVAMRLISNTPVGEK